LAIEPKITIEKNCKERRIGGREGRWDREIRKGEEGRIRKNCVECQPYTPR
jgi:hypothetical protein